MIILIADFRHGVQALCQLRAGMVAKHQTVFPGGDPLRQHASVADNGRLAHGLSFQQCPGGDLLALGWNHQAQAPGHGTAQGITADLPGEVDPVLQSEFPDNLPQTLHFRAVPHHQQGQGSHTLLESVQQGHNPLAHLQPAYVQQIFPSPGLLGQKGLFCQGNPHVFDRGMGETSPLHHQPMILAGHQIPVGQIPPFFQPHPLGFQCGGKGFPPPVPVTAVEEAGPGVSVHQALAAFAAVSGKGLGRAHRGEVGEHDPHGHICRRQGVHHAVGQGAVHLPHQCQIRSIRQDSLQHMFPCPPVKQGHPQGSAAAHGGMLDHIGVLQGQVSRVIQGEKGNLMPHPLQCFP